jgi:chromosomal replication initiation ATPase DnaA
MTERASYDMPVSAGKAAVLSALLSAISEETGIPVPELRGVRRKAHQVEARKRFIREASDAGFGCWSIARALRRDHTTILHHLGRV